MYRENRIMALIPARGGSKGIHYKNIVNLNGKPLIAYSIDAAKRSMYIDECYVSTEDEKIAKVADTYGAKMINRPAELATDTSKSIDAVMHAVNKVGKAFDYIVLLQPTQPLRKPWHIDNAIKEMIDNDYPSLVSVSPVRNHPLLIRSIEENGRMVSLMDMSSTVRRQEFQKYYAVNGAIYINRIRELTLQTSLNDNEYGYVMEEKYDMDIDEPLDLAICEAMMKYEN